MSIRGSAVHRRCRTGRAPADRGSGSRRAPERRCGGGGGGRCSRPATGGRSGGRPDDALLSRTLKPIYTAPTAKAAEDRFLEFQEEWGVKYPAIVRLWENAWAEFLPFLQFDTEIRRVVCTTNAIESVNARIRKAVRARGHFPNEAAALKCIYMAVMSLDPTGADRKRWTMRWKPALQAFDIAFDGRLSIGRR
ncbi:transposase-like protein [Kitasatospora sp. GP82]|nr:transposase-like protein [Kitasatospora sp. GP82]